MASDDLLKQKRGPLIRKGGLAPGKSHQKSHPNDVDVSFVISTIEEQKECRVGVIQMGILRSMLKPG